MTRLHGRFVWYELITTDMEAGRVFYTKVLGWGIRDGSMPGMSYTLFTLGGAPVAGMMMLSQQARTMGGKPTWTGHVAVNDVDAAAEKVRRLGGVVHVPPTDVPNVARFSIIADPQTATLFLVKGHGPGQEQVGDIGKTGRVGWHELFAADSEKAFAFYSELFGWEKATADAGTKGTYQVFSARGQAIGGMFTKSAAVPVPFWLYYFNVGDIDTALKRVNAAGGQILEGPIELPGGSFIARCIDPQGAMFALEGKRSHRPVGYFERVTPLDPAARRGGRWSW